jgi:arylsulfatase A-like enzyme
VRFTNAVCPSPLCAPSRASLACGREYDPAIVKDNAVDYPLDRTTFYKLLRESGYHVTGCGKFDLHKATFDWGGDGRRLLHELGFSAGIDNGGKHDAVASTPEVEPYSQFLKERGLLEIHRKDIKGRHEYSSTNPTPLPDDAYCDNWVGNNGLKLMGNFQKGKPWFLQVNFTGPHEPMDITESMLEKMQDAGEYPLPRGNSQLSKDQHKAIRRNYSAMVENIDSLVGLFINKIRERGELENTLIVYSSDHGEMLGDRGLWGKKVAYQPSAGVPLIIKGPGIREGYVHEGPAAVLDLAATFLDYAGLAIPGDMDSLSMKDLLSGKSEIHRDHVFSALVPWCMVYDGRFKLVRDNDEDRLYDLIKDPHENEDILDHNPDHAKRLAKLLVQQ